MINRVRLSEWMWRFLALAMLATVGWMGWVLYQLNPPQLITNTAFEAFAKSKASRSSQSGAQGQITFPAGTQAPLPVDAASGVSASGAPPAVVPPVAGAASCPPDKPAADNAAVEPTAAEKAAMAKPNPAEITDTLEAWARAWSAKDVAAYLAFYAPNFKTPGGEPRAEWEKVRAQRVSAPKSITLTVESPKVSVVSNDQVKVAFRQSYRSDIVTASVSNKMLVMVKVDGRWQIQQENAVE